MFNHGGVYQVVVDWHHLPGLPSGHLLGMIFMLQMHRQLHVQAPPWHMHMHIRGK